MEDKYYLCDYKKYLNCGGKSNGTCQKECFVTMNKEFAKADTKDVKLEDITLRHVIVTNGNIYHKHTV